MMLTAVDVAMSYEYLRRKYHPYYKAYPAVGLDENSRLYGHFNKCANLVNALGANLAAFLEAQFSNTIAHPNHLYGKSAIRKYLKHMVQTRQMSKEAAKEIKEICFGTKELIS